MKTTDNQIEKSRRFVQIMNHFELNQHEMGSKTGLSQPKISAIKNLKAGSNILNDIFYRLHFEFGISKEWWESGKGNMVNENLTSKEEKKSADQNHDDLSADDWKSKYYALNEKYTNLLEQHTALLQNKLVELLGNEPRASAV